MIVPTELPGFGFGFRNMKKSLHLLSSSSLLLIFSTYSPIEIVEYHRFNRIKGKSMLENKKLSDRKIMYQFLRRISIQNRTIAYDIVNRDSNEKQVSKVPDNNVM